VEGRTEVRVREPGGSANDVVHTQDHLSGLGSGEQHRPLQLEGLNDALLPHASNRANVHVCNRRERGQRSKSPEGMEKEKEKEEKKEEK